MTESRTDEPGSCLDLFASVCPGVRKILDPLIASYRSVNGDRYEANAARAALQRAWWREIGEERKVHLWRRDADVLCDNGSHRRQQGDTKHDKTKRRTGRKAGAG